MVILPEAQEEVQGMQIMDEMTEWTKTVKRDGAEFSLNATGTVIMVSTIYGSYSETVDNIRAKLRSPNLLPATRSMFKSMIKYYEDNRKP
jgi:hypothetical protein